MGSFQVLLSLASPWMRKLLRGKQLFLTADQGRVLTSESVTADILLRKGRLVRPPPISTSVNSSPVSGSVHGPNSGLK